MFVHSENKRLDLSERDRLFKKEETMRFHFARKVWLPVFAFLVFCLLGLAFGCIKGKKKNDPVTTADRRSEEYLKRVIGEKFPRHSILSEEEEALHESDSPFIWVIDPLDGTSNFMNGLPLFAVSIGVNFCFTINLLNKPVNLDRL